MATGRRAFAAIGRLLGVVEVRTHSGKLGMNEPRAQILGNAAANSTVLAKK